MIRTRRALAAIAVSLIALTGTTSAAGAQERTGDDNAAVAVNTEDGATVVRLAFSVRKVVKGDVDQTNTAVALASCTDCQTIALAFQVVLVSGDVGAVTPVNRAIAVNDECVECVTYASATQIVLGFDGPVHLSGNGRRRLAELRRSLRDLEDRAAAITLAQLNAEVQAAKAELVDILSTEIVAAPQKQSKDTSTSTTEEPSTSTTTTEGTSTTSTPETSTTSTTSATSTTQVSTTSTSESSTTTAAP